MPYAKTKPDTAAIIIAKLRIIRKLLLSAPSAPVFLRGSHSYPVDIIAAFEEPDFLYGDQWFPYGTLQVAYRAEVPETNSPIKGFPTSRQGR
jgi:hypothetical protein